MVRVRTSSFFGVRFETTVVRNGTPNDTHSSFNNCILVVMIRISRSTKMMITRTPAQKIHRHNIYIKGVQETEVKFLLRCKKIVRIHDQARHYQRVIH